MMTSALETRTGGASPPPADTVTSRVPVSTKRRHPHTSWAWTGMWQTRGSCCWERKGGLRWELGRLCLGMALYLGVILAVGVPVILYQSHSWNAVLGTWVSALQVNSALRPSQNNQAKMRQANPPKMQNASLSSTAVCLVGGARSFEATGPSIVARMLFTYRPLDLFVHAPLDQDSAKLWALGLWGGGEGVRLASVRIFANSDVDEQQHPSQILRAGGSPNAVQGLLQYFRLVEGCVDLMQAEEARRGGVHYKWVVRARLDSYWPRPPPSIPSLRLRPGQYIIPFGADNGGLNDRFGVGDRAASLIALRRLSMLQHIKRNNRSRAWNLNSEMAYARQFELGGVRVRRVHIPFCVLSRRLPDMLQGECSPPMAAVQASLAQPLDGAKCMPCQPCGTAPPKEGMAKFYLSLGLAQGPGGRFLGTRGLVTCNYSSAWREGEWQGIFDKTAGPRMAWARKRVEQSSMEDCMERTHQFRDKVASWDAPSPLALCVRREMGSAQLLGRGPWAARTFTRPLSAQSVVVCLTLEGDRVPADFTWGRQLGWKVKGMRPVVRHTSVEQWHSALAKLTQDSSAPLHRVDVLKVNGRSPVHPETLRRVLWSQGNQHKEEGKGKRVPICQLIIILPSAPTLISHFPPRAVTQEEFMQVTSSLGFQLDSCEGGQRSGFFRCLFFSPEHCAH